MGYSMFLVKDGSANAIIVISSQPREADRLVAERLQMYIEKSTGVRLPIRTYRDDLKGNLIHIGYTECVSKLEISLEKIAQEGFIIKTVGENLILLGKDDDGTQFSVFHFLEKYLGIRWFFPGELWEIVPKTSSIFIPEIDEYHEPSFVVRDIGTGPSPYGSWPKDPAMQLWAKANKLGGSVKFGRGWELDWKKEFADTHPEYFALRGGKRDTSSPNPQLCTSNPEVLKIIVERIRKYLEENPELSGVYWSPEDAPGFCECPNCQALDTGETYTPNRPPLPVADPLSGPSMTNRVFTFANQIAEELEKTHPGKLIIVLAYWYYVEPPRRLRLHKNVVVWYTMTCIGHWNAARRELDFERLERWIKAANNDPSRIMIYEYYINAAWPEMLRLIVPLIDASIKRLHKEGVRMYFTQWVDDWAINGLNYYVAAKLLWDSSLDLDEILQDFYSKAFGKAGKAVEKFFNRLSEAWRIATEREGFIDSERLLGPRHLYHQLLAFYKPGLLEDCRRDLEEAYRLAEDDRVKERLDFLRLGLDYNEATMRTIRALKKLEDLGLPEFYIDPFVYFQPGPSYPELWLEMAKGIVRRKEMLIPHSERLKDYLKEALEAVEARWKLVESLKGKGIIGDGWLRPGSTHPPPAEVLRELLEALRDVP